MKTEIVVVLTASGAAIAGSILTFFATLRALKVERDKLERTLEVERRKLDTERQKVEIQISESAKQDHVRAAEAERMRAEADKLRVEVEEIRRQKLLAERSELRNILMLFDRAAFDAPMAMEEPVSMFNAIRQTRIAMQTSGAAYVPDEETGKHLSEIRRILLQTEVIIARDFPEIAQFPVDDSCRNPYERREQLYKSSGERFYDSLRVMMDARRDIQTHCRFVHDRLRYLDSIA